MNEIEGMTRLALSSITGRIVEDATFWQKDSLGPATVRLHLSGGMVLNVERCPIDGVRAWTIT